MPRISLILLALFLLIHSGAIAEDYDDYNDDETGEDSEIFQFHHPTFTSTALEVEPLVGENVSLPCLVDKLGETVNMWYKGEMLIFLDDIKQQAVPADFAARVHEKRVGDKGNRLLIEAVQPSDNGKYKCTVSSSPEIDLVHTVRVKYPPTVQTTPEDGTVLTKQGSSVELKCDADGYPKPTVTWTKKDGVLPYGDKKLTSEVLQIASIKPQHRGVYRCTVDNGVGNAIVKDIQVDVKYAPEVDAVSSSVYTGTGHSARVKCHVTGHPQPKVTWSGPDGRSLVPDQHRELHKNNRFSLVINKVHDPDLGMYTCTAENDLGKTEASVHLVNGNPKTVVVTSGAIGNRSASYWLQWSVESPSAISHYKILYNEVDHEKSSAGKRWEQVHIPVSQEAPRDAGPSYSYDYKMVDLKPNAMYEVKITAQNRYGWSPAQETPFHFTTLGARALGSVDPNMASRSLQPITMVIVFTALLVLLVF